VGLPSSILYRHPRSHLTFPGCLPPHGWTTLFPMRTKDAIREEIWASLQKKKVARFPGATGRIPNFIGSETCARLLAQTKWWRAAKTLKVNPDSPQRAIRQRALEEGKIIYMAVPRLQSEKPFIELDPKKLRCSPYTASSIKGAAKYGRPVRLVEVKPIDLVVCGSVAVNRRGERIGKGGGYSDLEFALLTEEKKIGARTPIVTSVHPLQLISEKLPMTVHDIPLSGIITPEDVIITESVHKRPKRIHWDMLPQEKAAAIPVLRRRQQKA
jgi:5-formyltetrahydrofolate cyclo-ligase